MSLKAFHVVFIICSMALTLGFAYWGIVDFSTSGNAVHLWLGIGSIAGSGLLAWYGVWFLHKLKNVSYL